MNNKSFEEFVTKHTQGGGGVTFDIEQEIYEWRTALVELYENIEQYLAPYKSIGKVELEKSPVTLSEESLGTYTVESGLLRVGDAKYLLIPVGTMLIGSKGRVDLIGPVGKSMLALVKGVGPQMRVTIGSQPIPGGLLLPTEDHPWKWKIVSNKPPYTYTDLNENNFLNLLMSLA